MDDSNGRRRMSVVLDATLRSEEVCQHARTVVLSPESPLFLVPANRLVSEYTPLDSPEAIPRRFVEAWNARDPDAIADLFDADAEFVNVVGIWWHDREAIRRAHAYGLTRIFNASTLRLGAVRVKRLSARIAVVHARMNLTGQTPIEGHAAPGARANIFSFVVHDTGVGWRCASAHNTDVVPGAETHLADREGRLRAVDYR